MHLLAHGCVPGDLLVGLPPPVVDGGGQALPAAAAASPNPNTPLAYPESGVDDAQPKEKGQVAAVRPREQVSHRDMVPGDKGPPRVAKSKGIAATASQPSTPAFTAPAASTTTTFNTGLDVIIIVQEVFDGMPMSSKRIGTGRLEYVDVNVLPIEQVCARHGNSPNLASLTALRLPESY